MPQQTYCQAVLNMEKDNVHRVYHDTQYGFPIDDDNELFGRLILEINQAGLSWNTILNKQENFRKAYDEFNIEKVAAYTEIDRARLLGDAGIIRNKLKVNAAIHPLPKEEWVKLFQKTFKFTGGEITNEFLMSTGYLRGAHDESCKIYEATIVSRPKWVE